MRAMSYSFSIYFSCLNMVLTRDTNKRNRGERDLPEIPADQAGDELNRWRSEVTRREQELGQRVLEFEQREHELESLRWQLLANRTPNARQSTTAGDNAVNSSSFSSFVNISLQDAHRNMKLPKLRKWPRTLVYIDRVHFCRLYTQMHICRHWM